jgi:hypothetical protein
MRPLKQTGELLIYESGTGTVFTLKTVPVPLSRVGMGKLTFSGGTTMEAASCQYNPKIAGVFGPVYDVHPTSISSSLDQIPQSLRTDFSVIAFAFLSSLFHLRRGS